MKHLGDITKLNGAEIPPVTVITGGSPCQGFSVAGRRLGLEDDRSNLFLQFIRIIKEMRENEIRNGRTDVNIRPRFMVFENVPGLLSAGKPKGEDFRIVLEEIVRVKDPTAFIPRPQKWTPSGCILGDGWSLAWRVHDAQFWGVPQRRRRLCIVGDFAGQCAGDLLFEQESLPWDSQESRKAEEIAPRTADESPVGAVNLVTDDPEMNPRGGKSLCTNQNTLSR